MKRPKDVLIARCVIAAALATLGAGAVAAGEYIPGAVAFFFMTTALVELEGE